MFSGKSEELIRRLRRAQIAKQKVQIFKPLIDNRFSEDHIVSHSDMRIPSQTVKNSDDLLAAQAANQLFALAAEHAAGHDFNPAVLGTGTDYVHTLKL